MCESIQKSTARWMKWRKTGTDRQRLCCSRAKVRKVFEEDEDEGKVELVTSATDEEDEEDCEGDAEEDEEVHRATFTQKRSMWKVVPRRKVS